MRKFAFLILLLLTAAGHTFAQEPDINGGPEKIVVNAEAPRIPVGSLNSKARKLPMPRVQGSYLRTASSVTVKVVIDAKKGTVIGAEAAGGHPLVRAAAEAAARRAEFDAALKEFRTIYVTGTITYRSADFNRPARVNDKPGALVIETGRVINDRAIFVPKPPGVRLGEKFIAGRVKVAIMVPATGGEIRIANAFSGPEELRGPAERAAMGVKFSNVFITGPFVYVTGTIVYIFRENGKVE